uniref:carbonic anhydrase n=1 Tax=Romanomermis culicivorax TaxID=13658 RepID=A0A915JDX2_ROMCU
MTRRIFLCILVTAVLGDEDWGYFYGPSIDPKHWYLEYQQCGGHRQSPINIDLKQTFIDREIKPIRLVIQFTTIGSWRFDELLPRKREGFFSYNGSLTTPPCSEIVRWIILSEPVPISSQQCLSWECLSSIFRLTLSTLTLGAGDYVTTSLRSTLLYPKNGWWLRRRGSGGEGDTKWQSMAAWSSITNKGTKRVRLANNKNGLCLTAFV